MQYDQTYKRDAGKPRMSLIFQVPRALEEVVGAMEHGVAKYGEGTWDKVEPFKRYFDSMLRHPFDAAKKGDLFARDDESGRLHIAHECLNMLYLLELHLRELEDPRDMEESAGHEYAPCEAEPECTTLREELTRFGPRHGQQPCCKRED